MSTPSAALLQEWFERLADLPAPERSEQLAVLAAADAQLAQQLEELLAADSALADTPTEPLLPELALLRRATTFSWEGRKVGEYRVLDALGSGGMGTVYKAQSIENGGLVAIKFLREDRDDDALRRRFALERQVLETLRHPGIARLLGGGEYADGTPYVVMELVEGDNLLAYAEKQRLDLGQRVELLLKVCAAVTHAHSRQVIHRDIKNSNILVTAQGQPKLLDFGIAKPLQAQFGLQHLELTATAQRFFSASSAAPEQLTGAPTGAACDVYALGALLYELLCGESPLPLQGLSAGQIETAILRTVPQPPSARVAALAPGLANARARQRGLADRAALIDALRGELDRIATTALRKQPAQRQASVAALAKELRAVRDGRAHLPAWRAALERLRPHRTPLLAAGAAVAVVAALALWNALRPALPPAADTAATAEPAVEAAAVAAAETPPLQRAEIQLALAQTELERGGAAAALNHLQQSEALLGDDEASRDLHMRLLLLRAAAATQDADFPAAAAALAAADQLAPSPAERSRIAARRAQLLLARGRDDEAAELLRENAAETLPRLAGDDALAAQIRSQLAGLESAPEGAADGAGRAGRLEALAASLQRAYGGGGGALAASSARAVPPAAA
ncbi:serine/threonine-protein kinase, partial [Tahibacter harae]